MKNLDLATYGVEEMNEEEMVKLDGGGFLNWAAYQAGKAVGTIEAFLQSVIDAE